VSIIEIKDLSYTYPNAKRPAWLDINLNVKKGEFILLTGPSGCGKTTFCRTLNGLIPHFYSGVFEGEVIINGTSSINSSIAKLAQSVGLIFQNPDNQIFALTVEKDIAFGLENLGYSKDNMIKEIDWALDITGINHLKDRATHELSGGQKQRLTIASVLAMHPEIIVMDEPTSFLDPLGAEKIFEVLKVLNEKYNMTIILIEHRTDLAVNYVDRILVFNDGKLVNDGAPEQVFQSEQTRLLGIEIPKILELGRKLMKNGVRLPGLTLYSDELLCHLKSFLSKRKKLNSIDSYEFDYLKEINGSTQNPVINILDVSFSYPNGVQALDNISLSINKGEFIAIMGENGAGKSTLVKHLNKLLIPTAGRILFNDENIKQFSTAEISKKIGLVFQNPDDQLFEEDVEQEISFALKNFGFENDVITKRVDWALKLLDLEEYRKSSPFILSGGERKRVALASVLAWDPEILILDEPTIGQDHGQKERLSQFLFQLKMQGKTVIIVTHDVEFIAELQPQIILMSGGKIISKGTAKEVMTNHEALLKASVTAPVITKLFDKLTDYSLPRDILDVDEASRILTNRLRVVEQK
jgi:energy-coupling factor transport system ATP-binding protein